MNNQNVGYREILINQLGKYDLGTNKEFEKKFADYFYPGLEAFNEVNQRNGARDLFASNFHPNKNPMIKEFWDSMIEHISSVSKYIFGEINWFKNFSKKDKEIVSQVFKKIQIREKIQLVSHINSTLGTSAILVFQKPKIKEFFIDVFEILSQPLKSYGEIVEIWLTQNHQEYFMNYLNTICYAFWKVDNKVYWKEVWIYGDYIQSIRSFKTSFDYDKAKSFISYSSEPKELNLDFIPVAIFVNNEERKPEWYKSASFSKMTAWWEQQISEEYAFSQTRFLLDQMLAPTTSKDELVKKMQSTDPDSRIIQTINAESYGQSFLNYLSQGNTMSVMVADLADRALAKAKELSLLPFAIAGRNNKHTTEIMSYLMPSFAYLETKQMLFKECLDTFLNMIIKCGKSYGVSEFENISDDINIDVEIKLAKSYDNTINAVEMRRNNKVGQFQNNV